MMPAITIENLGKQYRIGAQQRYRTLRDTLTDALAAPWRAVRGGSNGNSPARDSVESTKLWALKDVSFQIGEGEAIGLIGRNGAGKTTLLKILARITRPTVGYAEVRGRIGSLLEVGTGFHPELTGRENVFLSGALLGMKREEIRRRFDEIVAFSGVEKFLDTPLKHYSTGMQTRLAFAVAAHLDPEILLVDEVLAVGDLEFQKKCLGKMESVSRSGRTVVLVSHNMAAVQNLCVKAVLLENGTVTASGATAEVINRYIGQSLQMRMEAVFPAAATGDTRGLRFRAARVRNVDGVPATCIGREQGCTIEVDYEIRDQISFPQISLELWNGAGVCVLCSTDLDGCLESVQGERMPGRYRTSCFIDSNYLRAGRYTVTLGSSIPGVCPLDEVEDAICFEIIDSASAEARLAQGRRGVIAPSLQWKTLQLENRGA